MDKVDWPKEAIVQMIRLWQTQECLYNPKNKFYHNKRARYDALSDIAEKLKVFNSGIGVTEIKNKMTYLRGQYTREIAKAKEQKSGAGAEDVYVPSAYWFSELSFLEDYVKIRKGGACNFYVDETLDQTEIIEIEMSPQPKKARQTNDKMSKEDLVLSAATDALQSIGAASAENEPFCNFIRAELGKFKNLELKEELIEKITLLIFDLKKIEKCNTSNEHLF